MSAISIPDFLSGLSPWQKVIVILAFFALVGFLLWLLLGYSASPTPSVSVSPAAITYHESDTTKPLRNLMQVVADYYPYLILIMILFILGHTYVGWFSAFKGALIGGLLLCGTGVAMMYQGISVDGVMDIKTQLISGSIRSSSAGLLVFIVGSALSLSAIWRLGRKENAE